MLQLFILSARARSTPWPSLDLLRDTHGNWRQSNLLAPDASRVDGLLADAEHPFALDDSEEAALAPHDVPHEFFTLKYGLPPLVPAASDRGVSRQLSGNRSARKRYAAGLQAVNECSY